MVCSPWVKRAVSGYIAALLLFCGGVATNSDTAWAGSKGYAVQHNADRLSITAVRINPEGNGLTFSADRPFSGNETRNFSVLRLPSPYRLLIDIPNAYLSTGQKVFPINQHGIDRVELSDNSSPFYSSVRAIVYVNDGYVLGRLNPAFEGNSLKLELPQAVAMRPDQLAATSFAPKAAPVPEKTKISVKPIKPLPPVASHAPGLSTAKQAPVPPVQQSASKEVEKPAVAQQGPQTVLGTPAPAGVSVVEEVSLRDNQLNIRALPGAELKVKNRFTLTAPSRLVLDIENAVLSSRALMTPMSGNSEDLKQIRVGQFDENTVRIVIETAIPEQFEAIYSGGERNLLAISPYSHTSITKLSSNTKLGEVQSIDLKRENNGTILRITASTPIVHRFLKKDDRITLDLLNEASHPTAIGFDQKQYPEIAKMRLEPLTEGQPNSKLSIHLANSNMRVVPTVSDDGKVSGSYRRRCWPWWQRYRRQPERRERERSESLFGPDGAGCINCQRV
jgi:hypothetical protein